MKSGPDPISNQTNSTDEPIPEGEPQAVAEPHLSEELFGRHAFGGGEVADVAGVEEHVRAKEVTEAAPVGSAMKEH